MLSSEVVRLINEQVNHEFYSAYLYLSFSNYYKEEGLDGFGNWYYIQAQEERDHAIQFLNYLHDNGENVTLGAIKAPDVVLDSYDVPLKEGLKHERFVTSLIHRIYDAAHLSKDYRTMQFLDWFVKEQCEEEKNAEDLVKKFELFGSDPKSLYMMDQQLGGRTQTTEEE